MSEWRKAIPVMMHFNGRSRTPLQLPPLSSTFCMSSLKHVTFLAHVISDNSVSMALSLSLSSSFFSLLFMVKVLCLEL